LAHQSESTFQSEAHQAWFAPQHLKIRAVEGFQVKEFQESFTFPFS